MKGVPGDDLLVQAEIFGPILPVLRYSSDAKAKDLLCKLSTGALGFYVFSEDLSQASETLTWCLSGTAAIKGVAGQIAPTGLPFGVGVAGLGT